MTHKGALLVLVIILSMRASEMNERLLERTKEIVLKCAEFVLTFPKWVLSPLREVMDTLPARTEGDEIV